jgi:hypothetical protein
VVSELPPLYCKRTDQINRTDLFASAIDGKIFEGLTYNVLMSPISCADSRSRSPSFFAPDVARRIAGTGSLGVQRYVILVEGKGSTGGHYLPDG